jgi:hypothetical protein
LVSDGLNPSVVCARLEREESNSKAKIDRSFKSSLQTSYRVFVKACRVYIKADGG